MIVFFSFSILKFIDTYDQLRLNQHEINYLSILLTYNEIEAVNKNLTGRENPCPDVTGIDLYQTFKDDVIIILLKLFSKIALLSRE